MAEVISRMQTQITSEDQAPGTSAEPSAIPSRIPRFGEKSQRNARGDFNDNVLSSSLKTNSVDPAPASSVDRTPHRGQKKKKPDAFLMTGKAMLNRNPKISPCYAQLRRNLLPPLVEIESPQRRGTYEEPLSQQRKNQRRFGPQAAFSSSQTESVLDQGQDGSNDESLALNSQACVSNLQNAAEMQSESSSTLPLNDVHITEPKIPESSQHHSSIAADFTENESPTCSGAAFLSSASHISDTSMSSLNLFVHDGTVHNSLVEKINSFRPVTGIDYDAVIRTAKQMYELKTFIRSSVAEYLMQTSPFATVVAHEFFELFNFSGLRLDAALREFLIHVSLVGGSSHRANLLLKFAERYRICNPTLFKSVDEIHTLTCTLILLNKNLHGSNVERKMSMRDFLENLAVSGYTYERSLLKVLYDSIKSSTFVYPKEDADKSDIDEISTAGVFRCFSKKLSKKTVAPDIKNQIDYKHGWLVTKSVFDVDGHKIPFGRRTWQKFYATLRGMVLYLHKSDHGFDEGKFNVYKKFILLHHAVASVPTDYKKRQNVFRLRTANFGEFLFEVPNAIDVGKWVEAINFVSAAFSTPAMPPPPAGSKRETLIFSRPQLPSAPSTLSLQQQFWSHQEKLFAMEERLNVIRSNAPSIKTKGKPVYDYFFRERYFGNERERYATYVALLREKLASVSQVGSRGSVVHMSTPSGKTLSYVPISKNPSTTYNSGRGNSLRYDCKASTPSLNSTTQQPALAEALHIASGCLPNVPAAGEAPVHATNDRI